VFVKGLQQGQTFVQTGDPVSLVDVGRGRRKCVHFASEGKPVMRSMIAHKRSLIAQMGFISQPNQAFAIKFHTSEFFRWRAPVF
jgi:hypothetical protein